MSEDLIGKVFFNRYTLIRKLGEDSFGSIYQGKSEAQYYALKLEKRSNERNLLENEAYIMSYLKGGKNI